MMTAADAAAPVERRTKAKHITKAWGYPGGGHEAEFAVSCTCGFNEAGLATLEEAQELETGHWKPGFVRAFKSESLYTRKGEEVITTMTDEAARDALVQKVKEADARGRPNNFASDLVAGFEKYGSWTDGQRPWAHKLANEQATPKPARKLSQRRFERLVDLMQEAATNLQRPKVTFDWEGRTVQLSISGNTARVPGSLNVTDGGSYGDSIWYGRILPSGDDRGAYDSGIYSENWVLDALRALNDDPAAAAAEHGHRTGACCFCNRKIETNESLAVGYGPVCADHFGLPWG